jgi:cytochrome c5
LQTISIYFSILLGLVMMNFFTGCGNRPDLSQFDLKQGKEVYHELCLACHMAGMSSMAPKVGSRQDWAPRIAQGMETLFEHSLQGFKTMPAKGGDPKLSDEEVKNAVAYIVSESF